MQPRGLSHDLLVWARHVLSRRWFWLLLPVWFYLLALIFTNTWWFKQKVNAKLLPISGLEAKYDVLWWFPGMPVVIDGWTLAQIPPLRAEDPQPILKVQRVIVGVNWRDLRHPQQAIGSIEVQKPQLRLSVELLTGLMRLLSQQLRAQPVTPEPNVAAKSAPDPKRVEQLTQQAPPAPTDQNRVAQNVSPRANPTPFAPALAAAAAKPQVVEMMGPPHLVSPPEVQRPVDLRPSLRLSLRDGTVEIYSIRSRENRLCIDSIAADVPVQGANAEGVLKMGALLWKDGMLHAGFEVPLRWHYPILETPVLKWEWQRLKGEAQVQLAREPGLPFTFSMLTRDESLPRDGHAWGAEAIAGSLQCIGYALSPLSIQAQLQLAAKNINLAYHNQDSRFDRMSLFAQLHQGVLHCPDFRLIGNSFSLLGNGVVAIDGRHAGVARFVLPPQAQPYAASTWMAYFPRLPLSLKPFVTEDRIVGEIEISGQMQQTLITANQGQVIGDARALLWEWWQRRKQIQ